MKYVYFTAFLPNTIFIHKGDLVLLYENKEIFCEVHTNVVIDETAPLTPRHTPGSLQTATNHPQRERRTKKGVDPRVGGGWPL
jgi:hypothetical protein